MRMKSFENGAGRRRVTLMALLGVAILTSACGTAREENNDRAEQFTDIAAGIDAAAPSDISGQQGTATYSGVAFADFGGFSGTADATLTADFDAQSISGSMTSWEDTDPLNYSLRGQVVLSNGTIANDGSFATQMAGNIERDAIGPSDPLNPPTLKVFTGIGEGQIYDSVGGAEASHILGLIDGIDQNGGSVSGEFVARR